MSRENRTDAADPNGREPLVILDPVARWESQGATQLLRRKHRFAGQAVDQGFLVVIPLLRGLMFPVLVHVSVSRLRLLVISGAGFAYTFREVLKILRVRRFVEPDRFCAVPFEIFREHEAFRLLSPSHVEILDSGHDPDKVALFRDDEVAGFRFEFTRRATPRIADVELRFAGGEVERTAAVQRDRLFAERARLEQKEVVKSALFERIDRQSRERFAAADRELDRRNARLAGQKQQRPAQQRPGLLERRGRNVDPVFELVDPVEIQCVLFIAEELFVESRHDGFPATLISGR